MIKSLGPVLGRPVRLVVCQGHVAVLLEDSLIDIPELLSANSLIQGVQSPADLLVMLIVLDGVIACTAS